MLNYFNPYNRNKITSYNTFNIIKYIQLRNFTYIIS